MSEFPNAVKEPVQRFQGGSSSGISSSHPTMFYLFVRGSAVEEVERGENSDVREQLQ